MQNETAAIVCSLTLVFATGSACAVIHSPANPHRCTVLGHEKLPSEVGGEQQVCLAINGAIAARTPAANYSVEVRVLSSSMVAATVRMADGRELPEQKMAVSDRLLNRNSIDRFAAAIAEAIYHANRN